MQLVADLAAQPPDPPLCGTDLSSLAPDMKFPGLGGLGFSSPANAAMGRAGAAMARHYLAGDIRDPGGGGAMPLLSGCRLSRQTSSSPPLHDVRRWEEAAGGLSRLLHAGVAALAAVCQWRIQAPG